MYCSFLMLTFSFLVSKLPSWIVEGSVELPQAAMTNLKFQSNDPRHKKEKVKVTAKQTQVKKVKES